MKEGSERRKGRKWSEGRKVKRVGKLKDGSVRRR